eukprot:Clim_evm17s10 gene=Clim_evmTU17s10
MANTAVLLNAGRRQIFLQPSVLTKAPVAAALGSVVIRRFRSTEAVIDPPRPSSSSSDDDPPTFTVGSLGFLPREDPLVTLPEQYGALESLLQRMTIAQPDGSTGLLGRGTFGETLDRELPEYDLSGVTSQRLLSALYRDLTFAASAYLLEPCDLSYRETGTYGHGRSVLPRAVAVPLFTVANKLGSKPFMEYAQSYALYNYRRLDPAKGYDINNMRLIRAFEGEKSEAGFILVHVAMVSHSRDLVQGTRQALEALKGRDRLRFNSGLDTVNRAMDAINRTMELMWGASKPEDYLRFRTFILGTKNEPAFPNGVLYEGVSTEAQQFRGESGANDSIIPTCDNLCQIPMPSNELTRILKDFRTYRPKQHSDWLTWVDGQAKKHGIVEFSTQDPSSTLRMLRILDQVRDFRHRHWNFTKEYIIKHTSHPVATGGSPIKTWLPNQLSAVLGHMELLSRGLESDQANSGQALTHTEAMEVKRLYQRAESQRRILIREVKEMVERDQQQ